MTTNTTLPQISKQKSTKDIIISILSREWPLSAKRIYNKVVSEEGRPVSYQAVHKIIKGMENEGLLIKQGKEYLLNSEWIGGVKKFASSLETAYSNDNKIDFKNLQEKQAVDRKSVV